MPTDLMLRDAVRSAVLFLEAAEKAHDLNEGRAFQTVQTAFGTADVVINGQAVDLDFHDCPATAHVRFDRPQNGR